MIEKMYRGYNIVINDNNPGIVYIIVSIKIGPHAYRADRFDEATTVEEAWIKIDKWIDEAPKRVVDIYPANIPTKVRPKRQPGDNQRPFTPRMAKEK